MSGMEVNKYLTYQNYISNNPNSKLITEIDSAPSNAQIFNELRQSGAITLDYELFTENPTTFRFAIYSGIPQTTKYHSDAFSNKKAARHGAMSSIVKIQGRASNKRAEYNNLSARLSEDAGNHRPITEYSGNPELVLDYDTLQSQPVDVSDVSEYLSQKSIAVSYVRIKLPFTADHFCVFRPVQCVISHVPDTIDDNRVFSLAWYYLASPVDRTNYNNRVKLYINDEVLALYALTDKYAPKTENHRLVSIMKLVVPDQILYMKARLNSLPDSLKNYLKQYDTHIPMLQDLFTELHVEDDFIGYTKLHKNILYFVHHNDCKVFKTEAEAMNRLTHMLNGNIVTTDMITDLLNGADIDDSVIDYKDIPTGDKYAGYYLYLASKNRSYNSSISSFEDYMAINTEDAFVPRAPIGCDFSQVIGYIWYTHASKDDQVQYDQFESDYEEDFDHAGYRQFMSQTNIDGHKETMAIKRNKMMHAMNGNIETKNVKPSLKLEAANYKKHKNNNANKNNNNNNNNKNKNKKQTSHNNKANKYKVVGNNKLFTGNSVKQNLLPNNKFKYNTVIRPNSYNAAVKPIANIVRQNVGIRPNMVVPFNKDVTIKHHKVARDHLAKVPEMLMPEHIDAKKVMLLCMNMMLPDANSSDFEVLRYTNSDAQVPTAATRIEFKLPVSIAGSIPNGPIFNNPDFILVVTRDPFCAFIYSDPNLNYKKYKYNALFLNEDASVATYMLPDMSGMQNIVGTRWLTPTYLIPTTDYQPHGAYWYPKRSLNGGSYMYMPENTVVTIRLDNISPATSTIYTQLWYDNNGTEMVIRNASIAIPATSTNNSLTMTSNRAGYYAIKVWVNPSAPNPYYNFRVYFENIDISNNAKAVLAHRALPDLERNASRTLGIRVNGVSGMISNFTNPFTVQGTITGVVVPGNRSIIELLANKDGSKIAAMSNTTVISQETEDNGCRVWIPNCCSEDTDINDNYETTSNGVLSAYSKLSSDSNYAVLYYTNFGNSVMNAQITIGYWFEYFSQDLWTDTAISNTTKEEYDLACKIVTEIQCVTANPVHWLTIAKGILNGIDKYGEDIGKFASKAARWLNSAI